MLSYYSRQKIRYPIYGVATALLIVLAVLAFYNWPVALVGLAVSIVLILFLIRAENIIYGEVERYVTTLSYRLKRVGEEALMEMPIGILLYNDDYYIEWTNHFLSSYFEQDTLSGESLHELADPLVAIIKNEKEEIIELNDRKFKVTVKPEEKLLYFFDVTEQEEITKRFFEEQTVLCLIDLDNYDDLTQGMDDQTRSSLNSMVTSILNDWALKYGIYLKRISSERFFAVLNEKILHQLEESKFSILDEVREKTAKQAASLTLSMGVGQGEVSLPELGDLAQSSLDLALGRGGDQAALKQLNGKVKFYGGKTNPMEKRTRVRARVISHALRELVTESDKVLVMGHRYPDMDAIGASMGIRRVAEMNNCEGYVVLDFSEIDTAGKRLLAEVKKDPELYSRFIAPEEALDLATENTLLVIVDTHKPSMVIEEKLVQKVDKVVVIDHHRRGEEFVKNPLLVYMEPYASSTAELITELLEYQPKINKLSMLEATALLAGIIVDTKSFSLRTGSRTFDAASYLRAHGADTVLVQKFLKEDIETYIQRSQIIETVYFYKDGIAIATGAEDQVYDSVLIAQAADTLLAMDGVQASFVIARRAADTVGISARSLGKVNVQVIMEQMQGGGHLSNAATQLKEMSIEEAEEMLQQVITDLYEGGVEE
ncbi:DHH family phosphoesterase [Bacillus thermotolerans]|uniref:Cyclic-di-AMP phosphodiesterase n=1 Tax=Bacillus thermotolerans TaxID=1221996 RepID=A0A0F5I2J7_BACTR|nr:DHH family phosphoesterase [Bacillus thermotolerans]KKB39500.1 Phosphoesterase, DHH family protein [Bacillus thermotolerans]